tara:strand:+ start:4357 stop:4767 length:411 start_codon:yes stop_codon:yes gene_type:complete
MGRKPREFKYVKKNDGRKNNGRKKGDTNLKKATATPSYLNEAKRKRIGIYALNAMNKVFGSEEEAWQELARQAKDSFAHLKLLFEYKYGRPTENIDYTSGGEKLNIPITNIFAGTQKPPEIENTIDITPEDGETPA